MMRPFGTGRRCADSTTSGCAAATAASKIARSRGRLSVMIARSSRGTCDTGYPSDSGKRKPPRHAAGVCARPLRTDRSDGEALAPDVAVDDVAEALPGLALESLKLNRGDR